LKHFCKKLILLVALLDFLHLSAYRYSLHPLLRLHLGPQLLDFQPLNLRKLHCPFLHFLFHTDNVYMNDGNRVIVNISDLSEKMAYYSQVAEQMDKPGIVDMASFI
jgi:hypothetical protein